MQPTGSRKNSKMFWMAMMSSLFVLSFTAALGSMVGFLWLYVGDEQVSLNEQMIEQGYAWAYDGGTKQKNFEDLREIRRSKGTLIEA